ESHLSCRKR
ncbi:DEAD/DEAH box helicase family protein, partial [Vibrio parahaemolyticus AQ3810]